MNNPSLDREKVEEIKRKANLLEIVRSDEELGAGRNQVLRQLSGCWRSGHYAAHQSSSNGYQGTSLWLDPQQKFWHCHECNSQGDVFSWLDQHRGMSFLQAAEYLAQTYDVQLPHISAEAMEKAKLERAERSQVREVMRQVFEFYHQQMSPSQRGYYLSRGISAAYIDKYLLGYAPAEKGMALKAMKALGHSADDLLKTGLFIHRNHSVFARYRDRFVIPYWRGGETVYSIARLPQGDPTDRPDWDKGKYIKHLTSNTEDTVSPYAVEHVLFGLDSILHRDEVIITEGVVDAINALDRGYACLSPATTSFRQQDLDQLAGLTQDKTAYLVFDNEKSGAGLKGALKTAQHLHSRGCNLHLVKLPREAKVDKVDLADYLSYSSIEQFDKVLHSSPDFIAYQLKELAKLPKTKALSDLEAMMESMLSMSEMQIDHYATVSAGHGLAGKSVFKQIVKAAKQRDRQQQKEAALEIEKKELTNYQYLKNRINEIRDDKGLVDHQVKQSVSRLVLDDFLAHGQFYCTVEQHCYWFDSVEKRLYLLNQSVAPLVSDRYGINMTESLFDYLIAEFQAEALLRGQVSEIQRFSYYHKQSGNLYVYNNDDKLYRLDGQSVELVDNGTDGVIFISDPLHQPFDYQAGADANLVNQLIVDPINFAGSEWTRMTADEQRVLFSVWLFSLFFESILPTKPIQFFLGEKGSGKSSCQRMVGRWLFGPKFDVTPVLTNKEDAFVTAVVNEYFVAFDNVDSSIPWLPDRLASVSTGQRILLRKYYTAAEQEVHYPKCFLSINARTPNFKRDDVADRMLIFSLDRVKDFMPESRLMDQIDNNRHLLWSSFIDSLNLVVSHLKQDQEVLTSFFRMADYATLGWKVCKALTGEGQVFVDMLQKMDAEQKEFLMADDPFTEILEMWVDRNQTFGPASSTQLMGEMKQLADEMGVTLGFRSAVAFGRHLKNSLTSLRRRFEIEVTIRNNRPLYTFSSLQDE